MLWHEELHQIILLYGEDHYLSQDQLMTFFIITVFGNMAIQDYSDEFAKKTFDKMYEEFKAIKSSLKSER
jgi:hypothetical protein